MENDLNDLSASRLRDLLLKESRLFISCLDNGSEEEMQTKKDLLKRILEQLTEKERAEMALLLWGKNAQAAKAELPVLDIKALTDLLGGTLPDAAAASQISPDPIV